MIMADRRIIAWASISMDGYTSGPGGPAADSWLYEHAGQEQTSAYFEGIWRGVDTAILGRTNYVGFFSVWPQITRDPATDPRTRDLGTWLDTVEKVVVSRTLTEAGWSNSRIVTDLEAEVTRLKSRPGRDIMVLNSASVIHALLRAGLVDDIRVTVVPVLLGSGTPFFPSGGEESRWRLAETTTLAHGAVGLHWRV
jgi:dihydrofolate reductase